MKIGGTMRNAEWKALAICHYVFIATSWCTHATGLSNIPADLANLVRTWLEKFFEKLQPAADVFCLEVYIEVVMCLKVMGSDVVADVELPQVGHKRFP
jgi:hypothetical protein